MLCLTVAVWHFNRKISVYTSLNPEITILSDGIYEFLLFTIFYSILCMIRVETCLLFEIYIICNPFRINVYSVIQFALIILTD